MHVIMSKIDVMIVVTYFLLHRLDIKNYKPSRHLKMTNITKAFIQMKSKPSCVHFPALESKHCLLKLKGSHSQIKHLELLWQA